MNVTRQQRRQLIRENLQWPVLLVLIERDKWPEALKNHIRSPISVYRLRTFLVQIFLEYGGIERMSICRTTHNGERFEESISWDELQRLKAECGRGNKYAVEIYPADADVVNVANMRHLWILNEPPPYAWRKNNGA